MSISRHHAAMIIDSKKGVCLVDLGSKAGTMINGEPIEKMVLVPVVTGNVISFGLSTRRYHVEIDFQKVEENPNNLRY